MTKIKYKMVADHTGPGVVSAALVVKFIGDVPHFLAMHRSEKVRSARNVWSWPTGLVDAGETVAKSIVRELGEELKLTALMDPVFVDKYENLGSHDDPFHWLILVHAVPVASDAEFVNQEPDKHDKIEWHPLECLLDPVYWNEYTYHVSLSSIMANVDVATAFYQTALVTLSHIAE